MEKGKGKPTPVGDNYDNVNMEMSDDLMHMSSGAHRAPSKPRP